MVTENPTLAHFQNQISDTIKKAIASNKEVKKPIGPCLKILELDVKVDNICLKDRFEWDINDYNNSPEDFAYQLAE